MTNAEAFKYRPELMAYVQPEFVSRWTNREKLTIEQFNANLDYFAESENKLMAAARIFLQANRGDLVVVTICELLSTIKGYELNLKNSMEDFCALDCHIRNALVLLAYDIPEISAVGVSWKELAADLAALADDYLNAERYQRIKVSATILQTCVLIKKEDALIKENVESVSQELKLENPVSTSGRPRNANRIKIARGEAWLSAWGESREAAKVVAHLSVKFNIAPNGINKLCWLSGCCL